MTDRESLTAAIHRFGADGFDRLNPKSGLVVLTDAARERLAQLPEKCEHGELEPHAEEHWSGPLTGAGYSCLGRVYPAELVERIADALLNHAIARGYMLAKFRSVQRSNERARAVAVLDALNGETP